MIKQSKLIIEMSISFNTQQNKFKKSVCLLFSMSLSILSSGCTLPHTGPEQSRAVQSSAAFLHLQRFTQAFLHLHDSSSWQVWAACGNLVQWGSYSPASLLVHSQLVAGGISGQGATSGSVHDLPGRLPS